MPEFRLQQFRGGWAIAEYEDGKRISRRRLESRDAGDAAREFARIAALASRPIDPRVSDLWALYREDRKGRMMAAHMEWTGRAVLPFFGAMRPAEVTVKACREYAAMRAAKGIKPGTIHTDLGRLRIVLGWGVKAGLSVSRGSVELPAKPPPKERHLTRDEFDRLLDHADTPHIRLFVLLALSTAARAGALFDLTWDRVDFERGLIRLATGERGVRRKGRATVPMTTTIRAALSEAKTGALTEHVLEWSGKPIRSVRTGLEKAARAAGVPGVSPHVFRHTAAVWMAEAGSPMTEISAFLGHADSQITERVYARYSPDHLRGAASALEVGKVRKRI